MSATLDSISEESSGLGYFLRVNSLVKRLLIMLSFISIYPILANLNAQRPNEYAIVADVVAAETADDRGSGLNLDSFLNVAYPDESLRPTNWSRFVDQYWPNDPAVLHNCYKPQQVRRTVVSFLELNYIVFRYFDPVNITCRGNTLAL